MINEIDLMLAQNLSAIKNDPGNPYADWTPDETQILRSSLERAGWVLVPVEPTDEMRNVGENLISPDAYAGANSIYKAMLNARPKGE